VSRAFPGQRRRAPRALALVLALVVAFAAGALLAVFL